MTSLRGRQKTADDTTATDEPVRRRFTVDKYESMIDAGIVHAGERVELIDGEIVHITVMNGRHAATVRRLDRRWHTLGGVCILVSLQRPVRLPSGAEPEPDVALLRPRSDFYEARHPEPDDVLPVIEVSETTIGFDRRVELPMYHHRGLDRGLKARASKFIAVRTAAGFGTSQCSAAWTRLPKEPRRICLSA